MCPQLAPAARAHARRAGGSYRGKQHSAGIIFLFWSGLTEGQGQLVPDAHVGERQVALSTGRFRSRWCRGASETARAIR